MIEVEVGDAIVEFPDGTSPEVMRSALQKRFGAPKQEAQPEGPSALSRAHQEGVGALKSALSDIGNVSSGKAEDYLGPSGMLRSAGEMGKAILGGASALGAYPLAAASSLGASVLGPALRGTESAIASGVDRINPEYADKLRQNIPTEGGAYEAVKPGVGAALSAISPGLTSSRIPRLPPEAVVAPGSREEIVQAAQRLTNRGSPVEVPNAIASDNLLTQQAGAVMRNVPGLGTPIIRNTEKTIGQLGKAVSDVAEAQGGRTAEQAGDIAGRGLREWIGPKSKAILDRAYSAVDDAIDANVRGPLEETKRVVADIQARRQNAMIPGNSEAVRLVEGAVSEPQPSAEMASLIKQVGPETAAKLAPQMGLETAPPAGLNYRGVKDLRSSLGEMLDTGILPAGMSKAEVKQIYGALTKDLGSIAEQAGGPKGAALWKRANDLAAQVSKRREELASLVGAKGDAAGGEVFTRLKQAASTKSKADTDLLLKARKAIGGDWEQVVSGVTAKLGVNDQGIFQPGRFLTDWGKLSEAGKSILYGTGAHKAALEDIARISTRWPQLQKLQNPSGTAQNVAGSTIGAASVMHPLATLATVLEPATAAGLGAVGMLSRALAKPATAASAAAWTRSYARLAHGPSSAAAISQFTLQSRNLANTLNSQLGTNLSATDFLRAIQGTSASRGEDAPPGVVLP